MSWKIESGPERIGDIGGWRRFVFSVTSDGRRRAVFVELSEKLVTAGPEQVSSPMDEMLRSSGEAAVRRCLEEDTVPTVIRIGVHGWEPNFPAGAEPDVDGAS